VGSAHQPATKHHPFVRRMKNRRSIRLQEYDYSQSGAYFITVCTHNKECLFGVIADGEMLLNDAGRMIEKWFYELPRKFDGIVLGEYIIMPNHVHYIIENIGPVGADLCVCPSNADTGEHAGSPLHKIVQWFKTMTTNEYIRNVQTNGWQSFNGKLWQRNYYEHVIRDENELNGVRQYIIDNPVKWDTDEENPNVKSTQPR
jgi:putative transposase